MALSIFLIDTDVLIDYLRGINEAVQYLENLAEKNVAVSVISVAELYSGSRNKKEDEIIRLFLKDFIIYPVTAEIAEAAGKLKQQYFKSHGVGIADAIIAATSQKHQIPLTTLNTKHFPMLAYIQPPYIKA